MQSTSSNDTKEFNVLYYKRKNKVHKSKGVSKMDGILAFRGPTVSLTTTTGVMVVAPRREPELVNHEWQDDDVLNVGSYEVEIVSGLRSNPQPNVKMPRSLLTKRPVFKPLQPSATSSLLTTRATGTQSGIASRKICSTNESTSREPLRKRPMLKAHQPSVCSVSSTTQPPAHKNDTQDLESRLAQPMLKKRSLPTTVVVGNSQPKAKKVAALTQNRAAIAEMTDFPDAIGTIDLPHSVAAALQPHQRVGVSFIWNCLTGNAPVTPHIASIEDSCYKGGCILADEMGLGKTLMTIASICALYRQKRDTKFIVVCPSSLVSDWAKEFDKWLGNTCQPKRIVIQKGGQEGLSQIKVFGQPQSPQVLIVSYDILRRNIQNFQGITSRLVVVDEGHRLKNTNGSLALTALESLVCESRLLLTATPIQNVLSDFYTIANFCCPGLLGDLISFRRDFEKPISAANQRNCSILQRQEGATQARILDQLTKTFMLRRLQKDVLQSMLPRRQEVLLFCRPSTVQCSLYQKLTRSQATDDALAVLTSLRKLCSHPSLLSPKIDDPFDIAHSGKLQVLDQLLRQIRSFPANDKVVIVSNFTSALTLIERSILLPQHLSYVRLDGSTELSKRHSIVDTFNKTSAERTFCFLLSSKAGGCGLNLIGANRLIMVDPDWNPASDIQAMARIYRHGQQKPCTIYRLFTSGTVEEVICQRQIQKGNLASRAVDSKAGSLGFSKEEIQDCFTLKKCDCDTKQKVGKSWPDYNGATSISSQGCNDSPLIQVANMTNALAYVHVVNRETEQLEVTEKVEESDDRSMSGEVEWQDAHLVPSKPNLDDSPSSEEEEYEFE